jgi:hypothetical protein
MSEQQMMVVNGKCLVSKEKLKQTDMFGSLFDCYDTQEIQLPVAEEAIVDDYIKHLQYKPKCIDTMKKCLQYADLVGDKSYLYSLVKEMLASWSPVKCNRIVSDTTMINDNLRFDIYCYFPFVMIPVEYHKNSLLFKSWSELHPKRIIVDGHLYTHHVTISPNDGIVINCYHDGSVFKTIII